MTKGFSVTSSTRPNPTFVLDESDVPLSRPAPARVRRTCDADLERLHRRPVQPDGAACQGGAVGTPFFLFTNGDAATLQLFADAYQPDTPTTGGASNVTTSSATVNGSVTTNGAAVNVSFQFGTTTAYGGTHARRRRPRRTDSPATFSAALTGLPANTVIHYRAVATSDFGTFDRSGPDVPDQRRSRRPRSRATRRSVT